MRCLEHYVSSWLLEDRVRTKGNPGAFLFIVVEKGLLTGFNIARGVPEGRPKPLGGNAGGFLFDLH